MWFGKKDAMETIKGVGAFIDEQQLAPEEQIKYKLQWLEKMEPFKIVQRIIVTIVMYHWIIWAINCLIAVWLGAFLNDYTLYEKFLTYAESKVVWGPTSGVVITYLSGGLNIFKK